MMIKQYNDIDDWVLLDQKIQDKRIPELFDKFSFIAQQMKSHFIANGFEVTDFETLTLAFNWYMDEREKRMAIPKTALNSNTVYGRILRGMKGNGVFVFTFEFPNFRNFNWTFFKEETTEMCLFNRKLEFYDEYLGAMYGPKRDDPDFRRLEDSHLLELPAINDFPTKIQVNERIDLIDNLKHYTKRLENYSKEMSSVFEEHRLKTNKDIEEKKSIMLAIEWEKYQAKKVNEYNSVVDRYNFATRSLHIINNN